MCVKSDKSQATDPPKASPAMWSVLSEHAVKTTIYAALVVHAARSALRSTTPLSYLIHACLALFGLWNGKGEVDLAIKRLRKKLPPGYIGFPVVRDIRLIAQMTGGGILDALSEARRKYGTMFTACAFGRLNVTVGGQDDLKWLSSIDRKALTEVAWPPNISMLIGDGAVGNQSGAYHRVLRRLMEPYFAPTFVKNYLQVMEETTADELERWRSSGDFQSSEVFKMYALRLFYASSFGRVDESMLSRLHDDFKLWIGGFLSPTTMRIPGTAFNEAMKARGRILDTIGQLIDEFKRENPEESTRAQTTIMGRFIYGKNKDNDRMMTRDEMKDNILNLIFAGHDTTFASISTLLYHLSESPRAMEALAEEVSTLREPLDADELRNAPVLNACIHESLRMDPPVAGGFRRAVKPVEHGGYSFDRGTVFNYSVLMATTDETVYTKSHGEFRMEQFLPRDHPLYRPEADSGVDPLQGKASYPIFGVGTHVCLGKAFARLELQVLAARMLKHYHVEVRNPQKSFFPVNGWKVEFKLTERKDA